MAYPLMRSVVLATAILSYIASSYVCFATEEVRTSFPMRKGINVAGPLVRVKAEFSNTDGQVSDFWTRKMYPNWYTASELREAGFDFVRLPVNPAVLLENPPAVRARLLEEIEKEMRLYLSVGLRVVVDLHFWSPANKFWTEKAVTAGVDTFAFDAYRVLVRDISRRLATYRHGDVAFELLNEPSLKGCNVGWIPIQQALLQEVRKYAPVLPVVVSGCGGQLDGLLALDRSQIDMRDTNLIFTFHFYEPFLFTHQGGYRLYLFIEGVPYPASAGSISATLDMTNRTIDLARLPNTDSAAAKSQAAKEISHYFSQAPNRAFVDRRFDQVLAWAKKNEIPTTRIMLGEFAAINFRKTDSTEYLQARQLWDKDVISAAEERGIGWAYWYLPNIRGAIFR